MLKILIIGSEGFIGSNLVKYFRKQEYEVTCSDIVLKAEEGYLLLNPEIPSFASLFQGRSYDICINATGAANVQFSFSYPHTDYSLNTANVYSILDAIRLYDPKCAFINLSSAAVYGNPERLPITENMPLMPASPYGYHKLYSENICTEFYKFFGIKSVSGRIFSAYGPGLKKQLFWDLFQKAKKATKYILVSGTGKETRDFIYIDDLVAAIDCIIQHNHFTGGAVNIASGKANTVENVVTLFIKNYNPDLSIHFTGDLKEGDPLYWQADINLLKSFGFKSTCSIEQGIQETVTWLQKQE